MGKSENFNFFSSETVAASDHLKSLCREKLSVEYFYSTFYVSYIFL